MLCGAWQRGTPAGMSADEINACAYDFLNLQCGRCIPAEKTLSVRVRSINGILKGLVP